MAQNVTVAGASFSDVPSVSLPKTGGGTASFTDVSDTTATAADVAAGSYFYTAAGVRTAGTASGGNDFIVTVSYNSTTQLWEPDCTVYEWQAAYAGGKTIAIECSDGSAVNWFYDGDYLFIYTVYSWDGNSLIGSDYIFTVDGVEHGGDVETIVPVFDSPTRTYTPTTSQQTETITFDPSTHNGIQQVGITVNAMPSGTAGTPTATKGTVSNHAVSVTPSVANTAGYISGGTKTGTAVTVSASELVSGSETKTANGTYDVTNLAELVVNVSGGGGTDRLTLLSTADMGTIETSSTSAADTGVTLTAQGIDDYDLLIVEAACTKTNGRHLATYSLVYLYNTSNLSSRTAASVANAKLNYKVTSAGVVTSRGATANYGGVYVQSCSISASGSTHNATMKIYKKYTSNDTNILNGTYTGKIYGIKLHELLGL